MTDDRTQSNLPGPDHHDWPTQPLDAPVDASPAAVREPAGPPPRPPRRRRRRSRLWGCLRTVLAIFAMGMAAVLGAGIIAGIVVYNQLAVEISDDLERLDSMEGVEDFETTRIYDRSGETLLYEVFTEGRRTEVALDRIPFALRWATIATEDDTFYENPGFDPPSILRSAYLWFREGEIVTGGSTITQQLVRQIVFDYEERTEQTLRRKLKEAALAWVMTQKYSKDEILELYLNEIYYGNLAYGAEEAANVYFGKHANELNIAEAAFLAGLPQSPATYDPYTNFGAAKARQRQVLDLLARHGYISVAESDTAFDAAPLTSADLASPEVSLLVPHFTVEVRRQLGELPGIEPEMIAQGGLVVRTTIDMDIQALAEGIVQQQIAEVGDEFNMHNGALVALNPNSGEVLAMVGSVDYNDESIDGAVNNVLSPHQPGSTMKPLTYAAALEQGWTPAGILWDVPTVFDTGVGEYRPVNYDGRFHGPVRLRDALANSYNIPAVLLLNEVGVGNLLEVAHRFGINSLGDDPSYYGLSLTLGGGEVTPLEMATAFSVFANGGHAVTPVMITHVEDNDGTLLYEAPENPGEEVLDPRIAFQISDILSDNDARTPAMGSESELLLDFPAAAKTGTTNDFRDNWTIGYTPHVVTAVWAGNTDNEEMAEGTSGLTGAAPIWHDFMTALYGMRGIEDTLAGPGLPPLRAEFTPPGRLEQRPVCVLSALRDPVPAESGCPRQQAEWFRVGGPDPAIEPTAQPSPTPVPTLAPRPEGDDTPQPEGPLPGVRQQIEPGILALAVLPVTEEQQAPLMEVLNQQRDALPGQPPAPLPPRYCTVPQERAADLEALAYQLFIEAPLDPTHALNARNWAIENGVPIEPTLACPTDVLEEVVEETPDYADVVGVTYVIEDPQPGWQVYGVWPVRGTVLFNPADVAYFKIEIGEGDNPEEFLTLGETHDEPVENGILEMLHAEALPPGRYTLQLVVVKTDGNFIEPYQVRIDIVPPPGPDATATPTAQPGG